MAGKEIVGVLKVLGNRIPFVLIGEYFQHLVKGYILEVFAAFCELDFVNIQVSEINFIT